MRISDWSSDVCSSDLAVFHSPTPERERRLMSYEAFRLMVQGWASSGYLPEALAYGFVVNALLAGLLIGPVLGGLGRSEEHTSELQSLMRISYAVFCLKKKN